MSSDKFYITHYRHQVQERYKLGDSMGKLRQREFEYLIDRIEEQCGVRLSISTLKRLWRDDVQQLPHPSTLNALVSVLNFSSWVDFKNSHPAPVPTETLPAAVKKNVRVKSLTTLGIAALLVVVGVVVIQGFKGSGKKLVLPAHISFRADKTVSTGVPNTVGFTYDVRGIEADSFFIQQSWNPRNKAAIDPAKQYFSSIYYLPGFHRAKLIVNDTIVARARIHLKTAGWFPLLEYEDGSRRPFYLDTTASRDCLRITHHDIAAAGVDPAKPYQLRYYNIRDFNGLASDNFTLTARVKLDSAQRVVCPSVLVVIVAEENIFFLKLTTKGCVGELGLKFGEHYQDAKDHDFSAFGRDMCQWQSMRIETVNKSVKIFLADSLVHDLSFHEDFGKVMGVIFSFTGPASLDDVKLAHAGGQVVYEENF